MFVESEFDYCQIHVESCRIPARLLEQYRRLNEKNIKSGESLKWQNITRVMYPGFLIYQ